MFQAGISKMVQHKQFSSNVQNELNDTFKQNEIVTGKYTILYILRLW